MLRTKKDVTELVVRVLFHICYKHSGCPFIQDDRLFRLAGGAPAGMDALVA